MREIANSPVAKWWVWIPAIALSVAAGAGLTWALLSILTPPADPSEATNYTFVAVAPGEVGASIALNTVTEWFPVPVGANMASGVVTQVSVAPGDEVATGGVLYRVNQRPVVIAQGDVPMFRAVGPDSAGADVAQLQEMLTALEYYSGAVDGRFGQGTTAAVKAWQKFLGLEPTGVVEIADMIFIPSLPARVSLDEKVIARGLSVSGGEQAVRSLPTSPAFTVPVAESQASVMPAGTRVEIASPEGGVWEGRVTDQARNNESGTVTVQLGGADGEPVCGNECAQVPVNGKTTLSSQVITVEPVTGLVVPSAALVTGADGQIMVIDDTGARLPVKVISAARGMSVVEGVLEGTPVRVPANGTTP